MERTIENCFYCQSLGGISKKLGLCSFCGKKSRPVMVPFEVYEAGKMKRFCCGCAWWRLPHSETEKVAEEKWHQQWKKELTEQLVERCQKRIEKYFNHATH